MYEMQAMGPDIELTLPLVPASVQEPSPVPFLFLSHESLPEVPSGANLVIPTSIIIGFLREIVYTLAAGPKHRSCKEPMAQIAAGNICNCRVGRTEAIGCSRMVHIRRSLT